MSELVIKAENISKLYRLGSTGTGSLRQDVQWWWQRQILRKPTPFFSTSENVTLADESAQNGFIWALKDVNFEIKHGEAWGIIGRNGAGKSTFLKILSRIIKPTSGVVRGRGKISSLLEVGTGFHQDLSGRENIYISGYMLGMKKHDIQSKFDEIVAFSGVEKFLDTPVKRYSSGMYVRLAFAVAAHLEPDILIVDEVLAVGDAEFQKKCIGKMKDASANSGRTIIFVSHNLQAVSGLCSNAIWLENGRVRTSGDSKTVVNTYLSTLQKKTFALNYTSIEEAPGNDAIKLLSVELIPHLEDPKALIDIRTALTVKFKFFNANDKINLSVDLLLFTLSGECVFDIPSRQDEYNAGIIEAECTIPGNFLNDGAYYFSLFFVKNTNEPLLNFEECLNFEVADYRENNNWYDKWWGYVRPSFPLTLNPVEIETAPRQKTPAMS